MKSPKTEDSVVDRFARNQDAIWALLIEFMEADPDNQNGDSITIADLLVTVLVKGEDVP